MNKNNLITIFRNLNRNRLYTFLNVLGLSLGLMISFIIFSWVKSELSYDKFHVDHDRIYRLVVKGETGSDASFSPAAKTFLIDQIPEIESCVRIFKGSQLGNIKIKVDDVTYIDDEIYWADGEFFNIFSFPLLFGDLEEVFIKPNSAIITEETAKKYFGDEEPVGKTLLLADRLLVEITGVLNDLPEQSHFHFDILVNMKSHPWANWLEKSDLGSNWMFHTYFKTIPKANALDLNKKINKAISESIPPGYIMELYFQPITDIHLKSAMEGELEANNDIRYIYLFTSIAILVIIIAAINYINLTTAYSFERAKEIGIRKVLGANKRQLVQQLIIESLIISMLAMVLAFIFIEVGQQLFMTAWEISYTGILYNIQSLLFFLCVAISIGLFSGIIPAIVLSSFHPMKALRSGHNIMDKSGGMRRILVIFQFSVSLLIIIGTAVIYKQLTYLQNKKLGYDKDHAIAIDVGYPGFQVASFKNALLSDSRIINATGVTALPSNILYEEYIDVSNTENQLPSYMSENKHRVNYMSIDNDFFKTMNINIVRGGEMIENLASKQYSNKYVLNKSALETIGWSEDEAINQQIIIRHGNMEPGPVIGIIEDFHFQSLHFPITPLVLEFGTQPFYLLVRINNKYMNESIRFIESTWKEFSNDTPFKYSFLDQEYDMLYKSEARIGKLFIGFATVSVIIAMLGLFGLTSYSVIKRTKEIGIRKVFGATPANIFILMTRDFTRQILISVVISIPLAVIFMNEWLQEFAYKININSLMIIFSAIIILLLALLIVGYHSMQAANTNPVKTLRCE